MLCLILFLPDALRNQKVHELLRRRTACPSLGECPAMRTRRTIEHTERLSMPEQRFANSLMVVRFSEVVNLRCRSVCPRLTPRQNRGFYVFGTDTTTVSIQSFNKITATPSRVVAASRLGDSSHIFGTSLKPLLVAVDDALPDTFLTLTDEGVGLQSNRSSP